MLQPGNKFTYKRRGKNKDIIALIHRVTPAAALQVSKRPELLKHFKGESVKQTAFNIWKFLRYNLRYKADSNSQQNIKLPSALLRTGYGDCKSFSLFTGAILTALGIPFKYVYVSYDPGNKTPSHVYVQLDNGIIIDGVYSYFNREKAPAHKYLKKP